MKNLITALFILSSTVVFAQANSKADTIVIKLTPFQLTQIESIDLKKKEISDALEKQKKELFAQLDEKANLIILMVLDNNKIIQSDVESLQFKKDSFFITKKKKQP